MEYLMFTVDWENRVIVHHTAGLSPKEIEKMKMVGREVLVVGGSELQIIQDPENIPGKPGEK
jgi:hypothetical protein